jgi:hypothetical protein
VPDGVFTPFETFDGSEIVIVIETLGTGLQTPSRLVKKSVAAMKLSAVGAGHARDE